MKNWILFLCFALGGVYGQDWLPTGTAALVLDPLESRYPQMIRVMDDSTFTGELGVHYQRLFGIGALADYGLTGTVRFQRRFATGMDLRYLGWGKFSQWQIQAIGLLALPELNNALSAGIRVRYLDIAGMYANTEYQVDLSGCYRPFDDFSLVWVLNNVFRGNQGAPEQGKIGVGIHWKLFDFIRIGLGSEKNYLYPTDSYFSVSGFFPSGAGGGLSYLFLEKSLNFFFSYEFGKIRLSVGGTVQRDLGETYRSSVIMRF